MTNKIFLTSMLALLVAGPALADEWPYGVGTTGTGTNENGYIGGQISSSDSSPVTAADCNATPLTYNGTAPGSGTFTFTADWRPIIGTITLDPHLYEWDGGGSGCIQLNETVSASSPFTLYSVHGVGLYNPQPDADTFSDWNGTNRTSSVIIPVMAGYTFQGFYDGASACAANANQMIDASGNISYSNPDASSQLPTGGSATWYAHWTANPYSITYDCNCDTSECSGTAPTDSATHTVHQGVTLKQNGTGNCSKTGSNFSGWNCYKATDLSVGVSVVGTYPSSQSIEMPPYDVLCKANWGNATYTITYNCGDGSGDAPAPQSYVYQTDTWTLATTPNTCAKTGYHFAGWKCDYNIDENTSYSGTTPNYAATLSSGVYTVSASGTYNVPDNTSCTAMWTANDIQLRWLPGYGANANITTNQQSCTYNPTAGSGGISSFSAPSRTGYTFRGWKVSCHSTDGSTDCSE